MKPNSSPLCFSLQCSVDLICNLREEKNWVQKDQVWSRKKWCSYGGQLKPNAWGYCSLEKKKNIKQIRRSVRENFYFNSQFWDCAGDHVHQKGDVLHAELPGICFYNATSWKMSRLEQSKRERRQNESVHILVSPALFSVFCLPGSSISNVLSPFAAVFPGTWHRQIWRSMEPLGWKHQGCMELELWPFWRRCFSGC